MENPPQVTPFSWEFPEQPLIIKVTIDGEEHVADLRAYIVHEKMPNDKYLILPYLFQDYVIRVDDLLDRVNDQTFQATLFHDFDHDWNIQCPLWTMDGRGISREALRNSRLGRALYGSRIEYYKPYRDQWVLCFNYAVRIAGIQKSESAVSELLDRFYRPSSDIPFPLYFVAGKCLDRFNRDQLREALSVAVKASGGIAPQWLSPNRVTHEYIQLSVNPLGLYSTWVKRDQFANLVKDQTEAKHWIRVLPNAQQVVDFAQKLASNPGPEGALQFDAVGTVSRSSLVQWPGQKLQSRTKQVASSESANQWANDTLKWRNKDKSVEAEWLNLVAHRYDETTDDRFANMLFGTRECNTNMMRAEAAIIQLLFSGRTYAVKIETEVQHALQRVRMLDIPDLYSSIAEVTWLKPRRNEPEVCPYPDWLTPEFKYTITSYLPTKEGYVEESSSAIFHPFSRQRPFRYEYELDKILLDMYLDFFEVPMDVDPIQAFKTVIRKDHLSRDAYYLDGFISSGGDGVSKEGDGSAAEPGDGKVPGGDGKDPAGVTAAPSKEDGKLRTWFRLNQKATDDLLQRLYSSAPVTKKDVIAMSAGKNGKRLWPGPEHVPTRQSTL
ncbi:hypothetical protein FRC10_000845 [Ceratobasidium sp. 414]|nr:hypothetical protein FRC10_000845 [Ceratobasidium sp. 414]